jgi:aspartyl/glutamyl-tRNA(Asn/Gln) amidotransferase, C subunit
MEKLTREEVLHVARLARIELSEEEIEEYQIHLKQLIDEIDKIRDIEIDNDKLLITPVEHNSIMRDDVACEMLTAEEMMRNVPRSGDNYVEVPVMINE